MIKRRHDRGSSGMDVWAFYAIQALLILVQLTGLGLSEQEVGGFKFVGPNMLMSIPSFVVGIYGLYLLVVLGFLKGDSGSNAYGPDPLGSADA